MTTLLNIDDAGLRDHFDSAPLAVAHELTDHPLLTVEAIAQLAERLPADRIEHNYGNVAKVAAPDQVERSSQPVGQIARDIETNGCWMVLKNIELDPEYKRLLDECLEEVDTHIRTGQGVMTEREGFIFLSAPGSMTPAHTDPEHNFLLQIRGAKEMNVGSFPDELTEQVTLEQTFNGGHRNVSWEPKDPTCFDLTPGDGVYVYPHAPHWVVNGQEVSVSLSITFATRESERSRHVYRLNGKLRKLGLDPTPPGRRAGVDRAKALAARAIGKAGRLAGRG